MQISDLKTKKAELQRNLGVCPKCQYHTRLGARRRLDIFLDSENREEVARDIEAGDPLKFRDFKRHKDRVLSAKKKTKEKSALLVMRGELKSLPLIACAFDFNFVGGSMGETVGAKFVIATKTALENNIPMVCFTASGGARMQEGLISLMQMAKTSNALALLSEKKIPYVVVLCDPTTGGVSASLAALGDIIIAEPNAIIGFAGRRVIEQTVGKSLPDNFQRSEFLLEHGAIDMIVERGNLRDKIYSILSKLVSNETVKI